MTSCCCLQSDIGDSLAEIVLMIGAVKKIQPQTHGQSFVFKNIVKVRATACSYFNELVSVGFIPRINGFAHGNRINWYKCT